MSLSDKISNKATELSGKAKEAAGHATGDQNLEAEGQADQAKAGLKETLEDVKDAATNAADKVKDLFNKD